MKKTFWKNKTVLITGHKGFLGSWLTCEIAKNTKKVIGVDKRTISPLGDRKNKINIIDIKGDVGSFSLVSKIMCKYKPDIIFHLAAEALVQRANKNPLLTFHSNIQGTWNVLESAKRMNSIKGVIIASSDKAYGIHKSLPYTEKSSLKGSHPYDVSKSCADLIAKTYYNTYGLPVFVTRCGNIFGGGDLNYSRIVPGAMRDLIRGKTFIIRSDGKFVRDYIYVKDVVYGYIRLAENTANKKIWGEAFNFSDENPLTVLDLYGEIANLFKDRAASPIILNDAKYEIKKQYLSSKKAKAILKWEPKYTVSEALKETKKWYADYFRKKARR